MTKDTFGPTRYIVLLQSLRSSPDRLEAAVRSLPAEAHDWRPGEQDWSAHMLASHLAAAEAPFLKRLTRIAAEDRPSLPWFGPDLARPDSPDPLPAILARFRDEREHLLEFLSGLAPEDWERPAVHETMGPTTLALQVQNLVNHDTEHLGQLDVLLRDWDTRSHA